MHSAKYAAVLKKGVTTLTRGRVDCVMTDLMREHTLVVNSPTDKRLAGDIAAAADQTIIY